MDIPSSVCRHLAKVNKDYRYGTAILPGQGQVAFLAMLVDRKHAGGDAQDNRHYIVSHVRDLGDRLIRFYDKDGSSPCVVPPGFAAVLIDWPGQSHAMGNAAVIAGDHVAWLEHNSKPQHVVDAERQEAARQNGRDIDLYCESAADDLADYWLHLGKKETGRDPIFDKEDTKQLLKTAGGQAALRTFDRAKEDSFETFTQVENGFQPK